MTSKQIFWRRITGEAALIICSVFIAIVLESAWQERQNISEAQGALSQMLEELRQDRKDLDDVLDEQKALDLTYTKVISWLGNTGTFSEQDFGQAIELLSYSNRTMYPRRSAWTTMVASGQLQLLDNAELVTKLGNFYEYLYYRIMQNGQSYDNNLFEIMRESVPRVWDYNEYSFITLDASKIAELRGEIRFMHYTWNQWYIELLTEQYGKMLDELITEVDAHLVSHQ